VSKTRRHRHAAKRRRQAAAGLLAQVAEALTACDQAGLRVRLHHDVVETREGYVLPLARNRWVPRTKTYSKFSAAAFAAGDDD
jgi:hypothetical protein